jgi:RNA polymerase sigma factor (sigma-70 family)
MLNRDPLANTAPLVERVYAYVAYRIGDGPDAEDVTSEVFERAVRYRKSYDRRQGEPISWLIGIARRCLHGYSPQAPVADPEQFSASSEDVEEDTIRRLTLGAALQTLDERDQELLAMRYGGEMTAQQIAEVVGSTANAVRVAVHRAVARARAAVEAERGGGEERPQVRSQAQL